MLEQVSALSHHLAELQQEVKNLKRSQSSVKTEVVSEVESRLRCGSPAGSRSAWPSLDSCAPSAAGGAARWRSGESATTGESREADHAKQVMELSSVKAAYHKSLADRLDCMERVLAKSTEKHMEEQAATLAKLNEMQSRFNTAEEQALPAAESSVAPVRQALDSLAAEVHARHCTLEERVADIGKSVERNAANAMEELEKVASACMERALNGVVAKQARDLDSLKASLGRHEEASARQTRELEDSARHHKQELDALYERLESVTGRVLGAERHGIAIGELQKSQATLMRDIGAHESRHRSMLERCDYLEKLIGDSSSKHANDVTALEVSHGSRDGAFTKYFGDPDMVRSVVDLSASLQSQSLEERIRSILSLLTESIKKGERDAKACNARIDKLQRGMADHDRQHGMADELHHQAIADRIGHLEESFSERADRHAREVEILRVAHTKLESALTRHARDLEECKASTTRSASVAQRLSVIERVVGGLDTTSDHGAAATSLDMPGDRSLTERLDALECHCSEVTEKLSQEMRVLRDASARHQGAQLQALKDLDSVWKAIESTAERHGQDLRMLREGCEEAKHAAVAHQSDELLAGHEQVERLGNRLDSCEVEVKGLQEMLACRAADQERLARLERMLNEVIGSHAQELGAAHVAAVVAERLAKVGDVLVEHRGSSDPIGIGSPTPGDSRHTLATRKLPGGGGDELAVADVAAKPGEWMVLRRLVAEERCARERQAGAILDLLEQERGERKSQIQHQHNLARVADRVLEENITERVDGILQEEARARAAEGQRLWEALERLASKTKAVGSTGGCMSPCQDSPSLRVRFLHHEKPPKAA